MAVAVNVDAVSLLLVMLLLLFDCRRFNCSPLLMLLYECCSSRWCSRNEGIIETIHSVHLIPGPRSLLPPLLPGARVDLLPGHVPTDLEGGSRLVPERLCPPPHPPRERHGDIPGSGTAALRPVPGQQGIPRFRVGAAHLQEVNDEMHSFPPKKNC